MDGYLEGGFELAEFQQIKNALMAEKKTNEEKLSDFERKGNHWLELTRNWIIEANQAKSLALHDNFSEMKNYLKKIGSNRRLAAGKLAIDFKNPWHFLAEIPAEARREAPSEATNQLWWTQRESNSRLGNANAAYYHCTIGPTCRGTEICTQTKSSRRTRAAVTLCPDIQASQINFFEDEGAP